MSPASDQWYVQTDIGATLGPMPEDVLVQMARTGALLRRDQVRRGAQSRWIPASDVPGLFDLVDAASPSTESPYEVPPAKTATSRPAAQSDTTKSVSVARVRSARAANTSPIVKSKPSAAESLSISAPASVPNIQIQPTTVCASPTLAAVSSEVEDHEQTPLPETNFTADAAIRRPPTVPPRRWERSWLKTDQSSWAERHKRMAVLPWSIVTLVLVGAIILWGVWPRQRPDIFADYLAIYQELQKQRETSSDSASWTDFVTRSRKQLDKTLPWLEEQAVPGDREKSLLLYLGRDLNELLSRPRDADNPHQQRLDVFVEQLQAMYNKHD